MYAEEIVEVRGPVRTVRRLKKTVATFGPLVPRADDHPAYLRLESAARKWLRHARDTHMLLSYLLMCAAPTAHAKDELAAHLNAEHAMYACGQR